ncbi:maleylacetoacetate isomerase [Croceicoccus sp. F390]|uniref:Maleylacetoacetate isomerase n=1 Tax=Croceicoccus esteveae TaxID=3075597 RepID=A0ABU2ZF50_9SPHN|nr:maleylacetoacetate isomerase [Croceicoccus sp. F390]MDT0574981.1 maleylacetoacetate isomerase [Croceicoccus sp. F390]
MTTPPDLILHGYWRSGTSYRTRIALALKRLDYRQVTHDLRTGAQQLDTFRSIAPQGLVPVLEEEGVYVLPQSPAILEWLEERHPEPPLLPGNPYERATVRAMCALIGCDIHPLNNLRVLNALKHDLQADPNAVKAWAARWIHEGFAALETMIAEYGGRFAFGNKPTLAECYLVPQVYSAERFGVDLAAFPKILAVADHARANAAIAAAHPDRQPDADQPVD